MAPTLKYSFQEHLGVAMFNLIVTRIPFHWIRLNYLRFLGAKIGTGTSILMNTTVFGVEGLEIGQNCSIGFRCVLDARGGLTIDHSTVLASDVQVISGAHKVNSDDFGMDPGCIFIGHHVWIASRSTVLLRTTIGDGAVVSGCSMVNKDVKPMEIVGGIPAKHLGERKSDLSYNPSFAPWFF